MSECMAEFCIYFFFVYQLLVFFVTNILFARNMHLFSDYKPFVSFVLKVIDFRLGSHSEVLSEGLRRHPKGFPRFAIHCVWNQFPRISVIYNPIVLHDIRWYGVSRADRRSAHPVPLLPALSGPLTTIRSLIANSHSYRTSLNSKYCILKPLLEHQSIAKLGESERIASNVVIDCLQMIYNN